MAIIFLSCLFRFTLNRLGRGFEPLFLRNFKFYYIKSKITSASLELTAIDCHVKKTWMEHRASDM